MNKFHQVSVNLIEEIKNASIAYLTTLYYRLHLKRRTAIQNLWFNQQCKKYGLCPKYIQLKTSNKSPQANIALKAAEKVWLREETKKWFAIRDSLHLYIKVIHSSLTSKLHALEFDTLDDSVREKISIIMYKKRNTQTKKLGNLMANKEKLRQKNEQNNKLVVTGKSVFHPRVKNLTKTVFSAEELKLLNKGFKYNPFDNINKNDILNLTVESEIALQRLKRTDADKHIVAQKLKKFKVIDATFNQEIKSIRSIKTKLLENDLICTKADKGNTVVILENNDYKTKVNDFISANNFTELKKDPTKAYQVVVRKTIKDLNHVYQQNEKFRMINMNSQSPLFYGLPKLHKVNIPIRPVVSYVQAPTYKLAKSVNAKFLSLTNFKAIHSVKNSFELTQNLKNIHLPNNCKLISLDVSNLFTNIPTDEIDNLVIEILNANNVEQNLSDEILKLFQIIMSQSYFKYNNKFFKQNNGVPMGSPLSPLIAEIYMNKFENTVLENKNYKDSILYWYRYVDDILICWKGSTRQFNNFETYINNIHQNIKFTSEIEINNSINYLDLTITRINNKHDFKIYRKPTTTNTTIHSSSVHPNNQKLAAYNCMIHRLFSIPMTKLNFKTELDIIRQIAFSNGFTNDTINKLLSKKLRKLTYQALYAGNNIPDQKFFVSIPFYKGISLSIGNFLNKIDNVFVSYKTKNSLGFSLSNSKDKVDVMKKSGVYKLSCEVCQASYIGQTGRSFDDRIKEHKSSFSKIKTDSAFANHLIESGHNSKFNVEILHTKSKGQSLDLLEAIEINKNFKNNPNCLNDQIDINVLKSPLFKIL